MIWIIFSSRERTALGIGCFNFETSLQTVTAFHQSDQHVSGVSDFFTGIIRLEFETSLELINSNIFRNTYEGPVDWQ
jgi:hypothetical protein